MKHYNQNLKERVIADYLSGGGTYRQLEGKYGIDFRLINQWVQAFKDTYTSKKMPSKKENVKPIEDLPKEVKQLQEKLRQARLYNKLLEALVDMGKEKYGIDLRKLEDAYSSFEQAKNAIAVAISTYNHLRQHNSIGDLTPFEIHSLYGGIKPKRLWKNYCKPKQKEVAMEVV
jgi:transposase-like protein